MQCEDIKNLVDDYIDERLTGPQLQDMQEHFARCRNCAAEVKQKQQLLQQLRALPTPQTPPYLAQRIIKSRQQKLSQQWRWFGAGIGSAMAAGLAVLVIVLLFRPLDPKATLESTVIAKLHQSSDVHILVHSGHTIDDVRFTLMVPDNIELRGFEGRRHVVWQGRLRQGENLLSLPVVALKPSTGTLIVKIEHGESSKKYYVNIVASS